jgi:hypothetical protein
MSASAAARAASVLLSGLLTVPLAVAVNDSLLGVVPPSLRNAGLVGGIAPDEAVLVQRRGTVHEGDVVVFRLPRDSTARARGVGRVHGEPGELVATLSDGWGGRAAGGGSSGWGGTSLTRIQAGQVFVLTDEEDYATHSAAGGVDGRDFGPQSAALVEGKAVAVVWPPWKARLLRG